MKKRNFSFSEEQKKLRWVFLTPTMTALFVLNIIPLLVLFGFSLTSVKTGFKDFIFIGLDNYVSLFTDRYFYTILSNSLIMLFGIVFLQMLIGTVFAILIYKTPSMMGFVRVVMMVPLVISPVIVAIIWRTLIMPMNGGFDIILASLKLPGLPDLLSNPWLAKFVIIIVSTWEWTPFVILYLLAGLESLPKAPFESAKIDGANWFQEILYIIMPMLKKLLVVVLIFRIIEGLKIFPLIYVITKGGPGSATEDLTYFVYKSGFKYLNLGYASTGSMVILLIVVLTIVFLAIIQRKSKIF